MTSLSDAFCYWPNGTIAQNTTSGEYALPCDTALGVSSCCLPGQSCDTQFRCEDAAGNIVEASCTQKDFNNPYCPCPHGIVSVDASTVCNDGLICCGANNASCCDNGQGRPYYYYNNEDTLPTATIDIASYLSGYTPSTAATNAESQTSTSNGGSSKATMSQTASTIASIAAPTITTTSSSSGSSNGLSSGAEAGIGVGIACAVLAIAFLGWFIVRRRRKSKVKGLGSQGQRLDENDFEGDTWFRNEVEGDAHQRSQKAFEMEQRNDTFGVVVPSSIKSRSPVASRKTELDASLPYHDSPRESELEQPSARPNELESSLQQRVDPKRLPLNELESPQHRHELE